MPGTDLEVIPTEVLAMDVDITPMQSMRWLLFLGAQLRDAARVLEETRRVELEKVDAYDRAKRRAILSPAGPVAGRGPGEVLAVVRNAWVADQVDAEQFEAAIATQAREAAERYVKTINAQIRVIQSIASVAKAELRAGAR